MIKIIRFYFNNELLHRQAYAVRTKVFVEEQHVDPELEYDEFEETAHHYIAFYDDLVVGTARWRETGKGIKLERFAVLPEFRNRGIGEVILKEVLKDVIPLEKMIYLHSQVKAVPFYERNGFEKTGEQFTEAGIGHFLMKLTD